MRLIFCKFYPLAVCKTQTVMGAALGSGSRGQVCVRLYWFGGLMSKTESQFLIRQCEDKARHTVSTQ